MPNVSDYSKDYAAEIDRRKAINPNDPFIQELEAARAMKIASDPNLSIKYGDSLPSGSSGMGTQGSIESQNILNQAPGYEGSILDGYSSVSDMQKDAQIAAQPTQDQTIQDYINGLKEAQRKSRLAGLESAYNNAMSGLNSEQATIAPAYQGKRNQAAAQSDVGAMNFGQYMAARGIKGNAGAMPEIYRNAALQGQLGSLDQQESAAKGDIERRRSGLTSAYQSDVASANADIDAQALQNMLEAYKADQAQKAEDNRAMGLTSTGQTTLAGKQYADSKQSQLEAAYARNVGQFANDYAAEMDRVKNDGDPSNDWQLAYLGSARQEKLQALAEQKAAEAAAAGEAAQQAWKDAMENWKTYGVVSEKDAAILGVPAGTKTAGFNIDSINAATSRMNAETSRINANRASSTAEDKNPLTTNSYLTQVNDILSKTVDVTDYKGVVQKVPDMTRAEFNAYLNAMFPDTPEGDKAYDAVYAALNADNIRFKDEVATQMH